MENLDRISLLNRRNFLSLVSIAIAPVNLSCRPECSVRVAKVHVAELEFDTAVLEIVGATEAGDSLLPGFNNAFVCALKQVLGVSVLPTQVMDLDHIDGCGLFSVIVTVDGISRKYRVWNYLASCQPEYPVTDARLLDK